MKRIKMLSLLGLVVTAMLTFAASASAVITTAPEGTKYTGTWHAEAEGKVVLHGPAGTGIRIACESTIHGEKLETVSGSTRSAIKTMTFTSCEGGTTHAVVIRGELIIHSAGAGNGAVTWTGGETSITVSSIFGTINCIYTTTSTPIGVLTGATNTSGKSHATLDIAATIARTGGSGLCGNSGQWTGSYKFNTPTGLTIT